ncbi:DUF3570 domain-containing protein [Flavobacterium sp.]|uniref:DUF3570 domain-containing protein n=1 Tax=Flavobacterium sp. TaxID=239 RepID=UPI0038D22AC1
MKNHLLILLLFITLISFSQEKAKDTVVKFKKAVLENTEADILMSYYKQDGTHSAVSGGIGSEKLTDFATNIVVAVPMNDDDVLTIDTGISAYTSASSSNINPFMSNSTTSGASGHTTTTNSPPIGTPWLASSGASASDKLISISGNYSHSSDSRNFIWNADVSASNEYDYTSFGFGGGITKLFNKKNTELSLKTNIYLDKWRPIYPTELHEYAKYGSTFQYNGYLSGVTIMNENGVGSNLYKPIKFKTLDVEKRNSYSVSFSFSQIINRKLQLSLFFDLLRQEGLLSTPYHRMYFSDMANYYIGTKQYISSYESSNNVGVYRLADDIERLPSTRLKFPVGIRVNYYLDEIFKIRTYYRYYTDDWGINSHTANIEIPIKINDKYTVYPMYRYYSQNACSYFAPFEQHVSTETYYTSDYDLSKFQSNQYGVGATYLDIFTNFKLFGFGLKNIDFRYNYYQRSDGLNANIFTFNFKFVL